MSQYFKNYTLPAGAAIFSMFFGAGNSVFPIKLGLDAGGQLPFALLGLLLTGIGGPMLGLLTTLRYEGDSRRFFSRWGSFIGLCFLVLSLSLLGPFCVLPRCFIVAYAAFSSLYAGVSQIWFFIGLGLLSLLCGLKRGYLLSILGRVLAPLLLVSLLTIIFSGIWQGDALLGGSLSPLAAFGRGISCGYDTMDLIAAIIFSGSIWSLLAAYHSDKNELYTTAWKASVIGGGLLAIVYFGLAIVTSMHAEKLRDVPPEALLATLAHITLGAKLAFVANLAVVLACFTTVISLTYAIARIGKRELFSEKVSETALITCITVLTVYFANFGFSAIQQSLHYIVSVAYPVIIVLTVFNLKNRNEVLVTGTIRGK